MLNLLIGPKLSRLTVFTLVWLIGMLQLISDASTGLVATFSGFEPLGPSSRKTGLVISEIMYNPAHRADQRVAEFVELYNTTPFQQDLSGYRLSDAISFQFPSGTILRPQQFLVIAKAPRDLEAIAGIGGVLGPYEGSLKGSETLRLRSETDAILLEVAYSDQPPWPVAAYGAGHSLALARPSFGEGSHRAWDISEAVGGSPGTNDVVRPDPLRSVVINEFLARTDDPLLDYIELYNHSQSEVDLSGCVLTDDIRTNRFIVPPGHSISPGGFVSFDQKLLGFALDGAGETLFLKTPDGSRVLDAVRYKAQAANVASGRYPDGAAEFYPLQNRTPGLPNSAPRQSGIVINEIMYAPLSGDARDQYVELYNAGASAVDVSGWHFVAGIDFRFPAGTILNAANYLVIAKDTAHLMAQHPTLSTANTLGNFGGKLAGQGERLALARPESIVSLTKSGVQSSNSVEVVVDEVTWGTGGRWGNWAKQGGSSLELVDAFANHRLATSWADSDETEKAPWTSIESTAKLDNGMGYNNGPILNIEVVLLGEGECLLDDVEVLQSPSGPNLVNNGGFEEGLAGWVMQGNHVRSTLESGEGYQSRQSLHIRASSRGDTGGNRIRSLLVANPVPGETYTIRAKARWLAGWPEIVLRLHGNYMEAAARLDVPIGAGTPGARNSRAISNAGPGLYDVQHYPPVPAAGQTVVVTAHADDPDGVGSVSLTYRLDPGTNYLSVAMHDDGIGGDAVAHDGLYSGEIPGQPADTLVAFSIEATDGFGARSTFPNDAPVRECLVRFGDPQPNTQFGVYRQWFTQATIDTWTSRPALSNERLDGTFVYGNSRVIYNFGSRYAGSPYHQRFNSPLNDGHYSIEFPLDDQLLGTENFNKVHAPGNGPFDDNTIQREQTSFWMARQLGLPWLYRRYVAMIINGQRRGTLMEDTQTAGSEMVQEYFPVDSDGYLFKLQPWFEFANTNGRQIDFSNNSWCTLNRFLTTGDADKLARYRWNYLARAAKSSANDYQPVVDLVTAANASDPASQAAAMEQVADMEQWMRTFAVEHAVGNWDSFGAQNEQNMYGYKPELGKWNLFIWDYNIVLGNSGSWAPGQNLFAVNGADRPMQRLLANPPFRRAMWRAWKELAYGAMEATNVNPMMDEKFAVFQSEGLRVESPSAVENWIRSARTSLLQQLAKVDASAFAVTTTAPITTETRTFVLSGEAPVEVKSIRVNGLDYPVVWTSVKDWSLTVPLLAATNVFALQGYDVRGRVLPAATGTAIITYTGPALPPLAATIARSSSLDQSGPVTLAWPTSAGLTYQVEYVESLSSRAWQRLGDPQVADGQTLSVSLLSNFPSHRFYRIVLLP